MILARHAEAMFWAGRHLERTEHATRALDIAGRTSMHHTPEHTGEEWMRVLRLLGLASAFEARALVPTESEVVHFVFADESNPGSVMETANQLRENIRAVRDRVPVELWEETNRLFLLLRSRDRLDRLDSEPSELYSRVRRMCSAITGVVAESMPRDEGHAFMGIGAMLERSSMVCRLIRLAVLDPEGKSDLAVALRMASTLQAYRRTHGYEDDRTTAAQFLLSDEHVPRSVLSCLRHVEHRLAPFEAAAPGLGPARRLAGRLRSELEFGTVEETLPEDPTGRILHIEVQLARLAETVAVNAFDPAHSSVLTTQFVRPGSHPA